MKKRFLRNLYTCLIGLAGVWSCVPNSGVEPNELESFGIESFDYPELSGWTGLNQMSNYDYIKFLSESKLEFPLVYVYVANTRDERISIHSLSKFESVQVSDETFYSLLPERSRREIVNQKTIKLYKMESKNDVEYYYLKDKKLLILKHHLKNHIDNCDGICVDLLLKLK